MAGSYEILERVGNTYKVKLLESIWVYLVFLPDKLYKVLDDPLLS